MRLAGLGALALLVACGDNTSGDAAARSSAPLEPTVRDSAGITIYEHPADALERAPLITFDSVPLAVIGGDLPELDLSRLFLPTLLSDGRVVGFDLTDFRVLVIAADGRTFKSFGRRGEGPGEFRGAHRLAIAGDSILVSDFLTNRLTIVDPDDGVLGIESVRQHFREASHAVVGRLADGSWLLPPVSVGRDPSQLDTPVPPPIPVLRQRNRDGLMILDTIGMLQQPPLDLQETAHGTRIAPVELSAPEQALSWNGRLAILGNSAWQVRLLESDGKLRAIYRKQGPRRPVTAEIRDTIAAIRGRRSQSPVEAGGFRDVVIETPDLQFGDSLAPFFPHHRNASVGDVLWLPEMPTPLDTTRGFTALGQDGRILGLLLLPLGTSVAAIDDERVLIRRIGDEDGIVTFAVHRLRMP